MKIFITDVDEIEFPPTGSSKPKNDADYNGWDLFYFDFYHSNGEPSSFFSPYKNLREAIEYFESRVAGLPEIVNHEKAKMPYEP